MPITSNINDNKTTIYLGDKFDFSEVDSFRSTYENSDTENYIVDFKNTDYMDSSGLGMLINMKKVVGDKKIDLVNCKSQIKKVLVVSRFDQHFNIV